MAPDTASSGFADCALLLEAIRALTLAQAKSLIKDINNEPETACGRLALSGNKPEIINRLTTSLTERKNQGDIRGYQKFRNLILRYKGPPVAASAYRNGTATSAATYGGLSAAGAYAAQPQQLGGISANKGSSIASSPYSPLATAGSPSSRQLGPGGAVRINFRPSPFYEIKQFVSPIVQCPEAPTQADRKNATLFVNLTAEQVEQLKRPTFQLRLFCTTVEAHAASLSGRNPAVIEFPLTCEARVNNQTLSLNLRGSKKNVGRVPPPNLNKDNALALKEGRPNRIDLTYTNAPKRHVLVAAICQVTNVAVLVERLRSTQFRSKEDILSRMRKEAEDDDIEAGAATMSLKCPLSYTRIQTPSRSKHCSHVQCFDAESFFSVNEQTPAWDCPVCHKHIKPEDLLMDGYVDDILKKVPQDEESVIVEPDGTWRTSDGRVSSSGTAQVTPAAEGTPLQDRLLGGDSEDVKPRIDGIGKPNGARKLSPEEIVLLDSPSPPPQPDPAASSTTSVRPQTSAASSLGSAQQGLRNGSVSATSHALAPPAASSLRHERIELLSSTSTSARASPASGAGEVIDLTLDSDEDEPSVPTRSAPSNGSYAPSHAASSSSNRANISSSAITPSRGMFPNSTNSTTPNRTGPFAAAMERVEATPEDEQIRRPGKRPRTDGIPTASDPRLVNGRLPGTSGVEEGRRASIPASYLDVGGSGSRLNGGTQEPPAGGDMTAAGETATSTYRHPGTAQGAGEAEGDDSWMDKTTSDHDQYLDEDEWWP